MYLTDITGRTMYRMEELYKMRTIDLCSGGIRRGFELAGDFENVLSAEIDKSFALFCGSPGIAPHYHAFPLYAIVQPLLFLIETKYIFHCSRKCGMIVTKDAAGARSILA